jgi:hypothetical protein
MDRRLLKTIDELGVTVASSNSRGTKNWSLPPTVEMTWHLKPSSSATGKGFLGLRSAIHGVGKADFPQNFVKENVFEREEKR